jgi:ectoine hydroxylase-related dioxygenase (phytanoyl-CoA dioxygenase family)
MINTDKKKSFKKNGFLKLNNIFDKKEILEFNKSLFYNLQILSKNRKNIDKKKYSFFNLSNYLKLLHKKDIKNFEKFYKFIQNYIYPCKLSSQKKILKVVSQLLDVSPDSLLLGDLTVRLDNPGKSTAHINFHQESFYYPQVKNYEKSILIWFPTHDIKKGGGGLSIIPGSHKNGKLKYYFKKNNLRNPIIRNSEILKKKKIDFQGKSGSILACNFNLLHGSSENFSGDFRITCAFRYFSSESKNFEPFTKNII